jgi:hypothetical protein
LHIVAFMPRRRITSELLPQATEQLATWMNLCAGLRSAVSAFRAAADKRGTAERFAESLAQSTITLCIAALGFDSKNGYDLLGPVDDVRAFMNELKRILTRRARHAGATPAGGHGTGNGKRGRRHRGDRS